MARYLTTIPNSSGFYNLGTVESYPTGGAGPTAYGPTSYFGSSPLPERSGDSIYNPINLGTFTSIFKTIPITNSHGGLTRRQTTFYKIRLLKPRSVQFTQDYSQFSYEKKTNKNTLLAFYKIVNKNQREELPINNQGYVAKESSIDYLDDETISPLQDYPSVTLDSGEYLFLITNDIKFLETEYSITLNVNILDWGQTNLSTDDQIDFGELTTTPLTKLDFGSATN
tara:strand:+ start:1910 stop:2587 length:678 start_codon:yes stop_codon:yes gene_type:complete